MPLLAWAASAWPPYSERTSALPVVLVCGALLSFVAERLLPCTKCRRAVHAWFKQLQAGVSSISIPSLHPSS